MKVCLLSLFLLLCLQQNVLAQSTKSATLKQPFLGYRSAKILTINGLQFKDLNRNGKLDRYEDWRLSNEERARDLLSKMSLAERRALCSSAPHA